ncbi:D-alanine--D-alanine ligase [Arcanobacterium haemolyticum]|nr:D-alanine--D-alanine ligase [Arcanobacterium haemolyticum]
MSGEHSVSCLTAASVMNAMDPEKYEILPIGIRQDGTWVPGVRDPKLLEAAGPRGIVEPSTQQILLGTGAGHDAVYSTEIAARGASQGTLTQLGEIDVAFPLLHGPFGEDGTIQGMLEMAGIPYVGSGVFASAAGMDKHYMKVVLESAGIPVAPYVLVTAKRWRTQREAVLAEVSEKLTYPVFVKPARAGSSLGITKVACVDDLAAAVEFAQQTDPKVLIEQGVVGREIECAVLGGHGDDDARASVLGEIVLDMEPGSWYDFDTKYIETEDFHMEIPAKVEPEIAERMRAMAVDVFDAFECEGMTRVDFFLTNSGEIIVNEHNTIPGFTAVSMYPILWENTGLPYSDLIDELLSLALERPVGLR